MAKKAKVNPLANIRSPEAELRRWCIEQAIRWPTAGGFGQGGVASVGGYIPIQEHNIIDRAERLLKWVTNTSR